MLITFSGLDGSGKSTLVDCLKESLEKQDQRVAVSHMNYDIGVYSVVRFLARKVTGRSDNGGHAPRDQAFAGNYSSGRAKLRYKLVWNKGIRMVIYPFDVLIFLGYRFYVETVKREILIMDRYFYDTLVDVTGSRRSFRLSFLSWLTPKPNLPVYLDVSAEEAFSRKQEYSVEYLNGRRLSYQKLIRNFPGILVLSTNYDLDTTRLKLTNAIRERMVVQV